MDSTPLDMIATLVAIEVNHSNSNRNATSREPDRCFACQLQGTAGASSPPPSATGPASGNERRPGDESSDATSENGAFPDVRLDEPAASGNNDRPADESPDSEAGHANEIIVALIQPDAVPPEAVVTVQVLSPSLPTDPLAAGEETSSAESELLVDKALPATELNTSDTPVEIEFPEVAKPKPAAKPAVNGKPTRAETGEAAQSVHEPTEVATEPHELREVAADGESPTRRVAPADRKAQEQEPNEGDSVRQLRPLDAPHEPTLLAPPATPTRSENAPVATPPVDTPAPELPPPVARTESNPAEPGSSRLTQHLVSGPRERQGTPLAISDADQTRLVHRVARAVHAAQERGGPLRLRLSPPELGSLTLELRVASGAISARIETETALSRTLLLENLPALRERLSEQGVRVEQFDVDLFQQPREGLADHPPDQRPGTPRPHPQAPTREDDREAQVPRETTAGHSVPEVRGLNVVV